MPNYSTTLCCIHVHCLIFPDSSSFLNGLFIDLSITVWSYGWTHYVISKSFQFYNILTYQIYYTNMIARYFMVSIFHDISYFAKKKKKKKYSDSSKKFSENDIINMLEVSIDNIFGIFGGRVFQQAVGISMVQTLLLFSSTCFIIRMRQTSYRGF